MHESQAPTTTKAPVPLACRKSGRGLRAPGRRGLNCSGQIPPLPLPAEVVANAPLLYYRLHGVPELYKSSYDTAFLQRLTRDVTTAEGVREVCVFFNNGIGGVGALDA